MDRSGFRQIFLSILIMSQLGLSAEASEEDSKAQIFTQFCVGTPEDCESAQVTNSFAIPAESEPLIGFSASEEEELGAQFDSAEAFQAPLMDEGWERRPVYNALQDTVDLGDRSQNLGVGEEIAAGASLGIRLRFESARRRPAAVNEER